MKVKEIPIDKEVMINGFSYTYKGIKRIRSLTVGVEQKIVFERNNGTNYDYKYFDLTVGNKELKEVNGTLEMK